MGKERKGVGDIGWLSRGARVVPSGAYRKRGAVRVAREWEGEARDLSRR